MAVSGRATSVRSEETQTSIVRYSPQRSRTGVRHRHGQLDTVYPPSQSMLMHRRLSEAGVESVCRIVPNVGHGFYECTAQEAHALLDESVSFLGNRL